MGLGLLDARRVLERLPRLHAGRPRLDVPARIGGRSLARHLHRVSLCAPPPPAHSTDSSGFFTYSLSKIKDVYDYNFCFIGNPEYPVTIKRMSLAGLKSNSKYLFFTLNKLVDLTIKITRKSRTPVCDTLRLIWESDGVFGLSLYPYKIDNYRKTDNSYGLRSDRDLTWIGGKVNSTVHTKVFADKMTELSWELHRNGKKEEFTDTITCKRDFANIVYFSY